MKHAVAITISFKATGGPDTFFDIYSACDFLDANSPDDLEAYHIKRGGQRLCGAMDYVVILNTLGSVASIASLIWLAYEKFVLPNRHKVREETDRPELMVEVCRDAGEPYWIHLGEAEGENAEVFVKALQQEVEEASEDPGAPDAIVDVLGQVKSYTDVFISKQRK